MHADRSIQEDRGRYGSIASGADQHCGSCQLDRLARCTGLTMRRIFSAALMEVIVQGVTGETVLGYELCFTGRVLLILIAKSYSYWLQHRILLPESVRLDGLAHLRS